MLQPKMIVIVRLLRDMEMWFSTNSSGFYKENIKIKLGNELIFLYFLYRLFSIC